MTYPETPTHTHTHTHTDRNSLRRTQGTDSIEDHSEARQDLAERHGICQPFTSCSAVSSSQTPERERGTYSDVTIVTRSRSVM